MVRKINGNFTGKSIISLDQFSPKDLEILFSHTHKMKQIRLKTKHSHLLSGKIVTLLFYEPSSRTRGSFDAAVKQLDGQTIVVENPQQFSSVAKGETFKDTIRTFEAYSDIIVLRHPETESAQKAADATEFVPVINAGDGIGEHPTQALLDLYTIHENFKRLDNLTILCTGDILYGRTIHSLLRGLSLFKNNAVFLLSPKQLELSRKDHEYFSKKINLIEIDKEKEIPRNADVWYWTRIQKERFQNKSLYSKVKNKYILTPKLVSKYAGKNTILMHPLPRINEIEKEVDDDPRAVYLKSQIRNGMYVRMALLGLVLGKI